MKYVIELKDKVLAPWGPSSISAVAELVLPMSNVSECPEKGGKWIKFLCNAAFKSLKFKMKLIDLLKKNTDYPKDFFSPRGSQYSHRKIFQMEKIFHFKYSYIYHSPF